MSEGSTGVKKWREKNDEMDRASTDMLGALVMGFSYNPPVPNVFDKGLLYSTPRWGKSALSRAWESWCNAEGGGITLLERSIIFHEPQEENVNYLFRVYVIDLKKQELLGNIPVICSDVPKATVIATMRLDLDEDMLGHLKFHVDKICTVPEWEG